MTIGVVSVVALLVLVLVFKAIWKIAEPDQALIISGLGAHGETADPNGQRGFKIVVGRGTVVLPGFQSVRRFNLGMRNTALIVSAVSQQSIPVTVKANVAFKVADDKSSISNAARRFIDKSSEDVISAVHELFAGHLRAIVGGLTVEELLHDRDLLAEKIRGSMTNDLEKLGLIVDSMPIQEIDDEMGYIDNLGKPQAAAVEAAARIAAAEQDRKATEAEQVAEAQKAEAKRESEIKRAGYQAEIDSAQAAQAQAGPLAEAKHRQDVGRQETVAAELDAERQEKVLNTQIRKPADAEAYRLTTLAEAKREVVVKEAEANASAITVTGDAQARSTRATGQAEADVIKAKGEADAAGIKARAEALAENQEAVIAQTIAEKYPEIVRAGAEAISNIDNMVVLNGAEGMSDLLGKAMTMGGAGLGIAKNLMGSIGESNNGTQAPELDPDVARIS